MNEIATTTQALATGFLSGTDWHRIAIVFLASALTNNIALTYFLGMCSFISLSRKTKVAVGMGFAVTLVTLITVTANWLINYFVLVPYGLEYLQFLVFILNIAAIVQILELVIDRYFPVLYVSFGIYLPLIVVNCAILGASLFMLYREYGFTESISFALGTGVGWTLAIVTLGGIRNQMIFSKPARNLGPFGVTIIIAGLMAMAFAGFSGMVKL